jgi:hypothetical protein
MRGFATRPTGLSCGPHMAPKRSTQGHTAPGDVAPIEPEPQEPVVLSAEDDTRGSARAFSGGAAFAARDRPVRVESCPPAETTRSVRRR